MNAPIRISDEVRAALADGRPVVALETAAVTHGLPRRPLDTEVPYLASTLAPDAVKRCFAPDVPAHLALGLALSAAARTEGVVPATVGLLRGELVVGLDDDELRELASVERPSKIAARDAALVAARGGSGGTTVAGTLLACGIAGLPVFATGGIGGVHRGYAERPDISADLLAIRDTGTLVVTAGAKSILDLPATVELLDTLGVPLVGLRTPYFPRFLADGDEGLRVTAEARDEVESARLFAAHRAMQPSRGMLLCVPPPAEFALAPEIMERAISEGLAECARAGARGPEVTPILLAAVARASGGRSLATNIAVLIENARVGARVATELAQTARRDSR